MTKERSYEVDIIRMAALIGICVVNLPFMALPDGGLIISHQGWDLVVSFFIACFFELKFFLLFSFIFGWGMAIQNKSAQSRGESFSRRYFGRMIGLALMGMAHAIWVFSGDILLLYAILGALLWTLRGHSPTALIKIALWMLPISICSLTTLALMVEVGDDVLWLSDSVVGASPQLGGDFSEATQRRLLDWPKTFAFILTVQGPMAFGAFAMGLAAEKSDFFKPNSLGFNALQKKLPVLAITASVLNLLYGLSASERFSQAYEILALLGFVLVPIGASALSALYLYLLIQLSRRLQIPHLLVLSGRNSLSTYVLQGIFGGFVFGAYGFGWFNKIEPATLLPLSLLIALLSMLCVGVIAKFFGRGPLEPVLRWFSG